MQRSLVSWDFPETDLDDDDTSTESESEPPSTREHSLVQHAIEVTGWRVTEPDLVRQRGALALQEIRKMRKYRPRFLLRTTDALDIRLEVMRVLVQTKKKGEEGSSVPPGEVVFWDGLHQENLKFS